MTRDEFLPYVMPELPGCPIPMVMAKAFEVLTDFCTRTGAWQVSLDPIDQPAGSADADLGAPTGSRISMVETITCLGSPRPLVPSTRGEMHRALPGWEAMVGSTPTHFIRLDSGSVRLYPIPSVDCQLQADVRLIPKPGLTVLPDKVMNDYLLPIAAGVKAKLMAMPKKSWSAPEMVAFYGAEYETAISNAIVKRAEGGAVRDMYVPPQTFGGVPTWSNQS